MFKYIMAQLVSDTEIDLRVPEGYHQAACEMISELSADGPVDLAGIFSGGSYHMMKASIVDAARRFRNPGSTYESLEKLGDKLYLNIVIERNMMFLNSRSARVNVDAWNEAFELDNQLTKALRELDGMAYSYGTSGKQKEAPVKPTGNTGSSMNASNKNDSSGKTPKDDNLQYKTGIWDKLDSFRGW